MATIVLHSGASHHFLACPDRGCNRRLRLVCRCDRNAPNPPSGQLTPRELEVVGLVTEGLTNKEIAAQLGLSCRTVHAHISNAMDRTGTRSRTHLAVFAVRYGLVSFECGSCRELT
jgi:DNA-binding NarL/FixJ family response regulator